ncbi:MAG TPA: DUF711 family protein [Planctomycetota bacterium]|nr:DUF711 family protein [Planctomycetota bacterium]
MRIRSITLFCGTPEKLPRAGKLAQAARRALTDAGFEVQTLRAALSPIDVWFSGAAKELPQAGAAIEKQSREAGFDYISLGELRPDAETLAVLPAIIQVTSAVFASCSMTLGERTVRSSVLPPLAKAVLETSTAVPNGFGNLRFCATARARAGTPFFPAATARDRDDFSFALALECADLALEAAQAASSSIDAMAKLSSAIEGHSAAMQKILEACAREHACEFLGFDWSLAPHPDQNRSIGAALEALSGAPIGEWGTLSAVAQLTRAVKSANVRHTGFSGVFLPVLEDFTLAQRAGENRFDLQRLLLYSAVCGSGLDTIPLPGDVKPEAISALLSDVATLALVLNKPLTVRLMPVPGLRAGEKTTFDFPYLINTQPLALSGAAQKLLRDSCVLL